MLPTLESGNRKGMTIFDPFVGSGSLGIAAASMGINYIGAELDDEYCEIARARIARASGQIVAMPERRSIAHRPMPLFEGAVA